MAAPPVRPGPVHAGGAGTDSAMGEPFGGFLPRFYAAYRARAQSTTAVRSRR
ncbi:hypothetical protein [Thauera sinica]|uniref:Uncharacterized protein n=1 Tax=Thauera sinica TaxID=2665146 RepID=A0ABW1AXN6_9RHOO|nr:hypothetical protein [Thauera sp. K11]